MIGRGVCRCIFFFKQKAAYEMRISDWSSDLCSSDLLQEEFDDAGIERLVLRQGDSSRRALLDRFRAEKNAVLVGSASFWEGVDVPGDALTLEIGRASCRERVCQYV